MSKIIKSVCIDSSLIEIVDNYISNLSQFVNDCLREKFRNVENIDDEIKKHNKNINFLKKLKLETIENNKLKTDEIKFFKETAIVLIKSPEFFKPRYKYFINKFDRQISLKEFGTLIKKYGN